MRIAQQIINEVRKAVVGKDRVLLETLAAIFARGHILLEDIPGVGKTTMALAFSRALGLNYGRVQFTPDVLPSDVVGYSLYNKETGTMTYQPGAVLCNMFLADELNRATSRTQSALLEAMEEGQVTVDGKTYTIPRPFTVIATQNPVGAAGTQLLPDSQMDRFTIRLSMGYPTATAEKAMIQSRQSGNPLDDILPVISRQELVTIQEQVSSVYVDEDILEYIISLISATRSHPAILRGASPRATLSLTAMAKSIAYLGNRDYVIPKDILTIFADTVAHRILLTGDAEAKGTTAQELMIKLTESIPAPKVR